MSQFTKIMYGVLFLALIIHPHFITGHVFSLSQAYAQSLTIVILFVIAYGVYLLHRYDLDRQKKQRRLLEKKLKISGERLSDAWKYIGLANRRLPLFTKMTSGLLSQAQPTKTGKKEILQRLLSTAVMSIVKADWGIFRFVEAKKQKTVREIIHVADGHSTFKAVVANKELLSSVGSEEDVLKLVGEVAIIPSSDKNAKVKCFLIVPKGTADVKKEISILRAMVDQAMLFHEYLYNDI